MERAAYLGKGGGLERPEGGLRVNLLVPIPTTPKKPGSYHQALNHLTFQLDWATTFKLPNKSIFWCSSNIIWKVKRIMNKNLQSSCVQPRVVEAISVWICLNRFWGSLRDTGHSQRITFLWARYLKTAAIKLTCIECDEGFKGQYIKIWNPNG